MNRPHTVGDHAFGDAVARIWNRLPSTLTSIATVNTLNKQWKTELFNCSLLSYRLLIFRLCYRVLAVFNLRNVTLIVCYTGNNKYYTLLRHKTAINNKKNIQTFTMLHRPKVSQHKHKNIKTHKVANSLHTKKITVSANANQILISQMASRSVQPFFHSSLHNVPILYNGPPFKIGPFRDET